ncbi:Ras protein Rab-10 [Fasciolopsis buskii]|uniref:Ras protein Rab-10 n=1 Tax=Fasciolopsis buskii TaxID=27845 RepID=A0A8E0RKR9_9TREM|nr:Ras protein Rab-10 [Fasciolopsis buski]
MEEQYRRSDNLSIMTSSSTDMQSNRLSCPPNSMVNGNGKIKPRRPSKPPTIPPTPLPSLPSGFRPARTKPVSNGARKGGGTGENRFDARFKVLLLGNSGVGKTSILRCLMGETFNPTTISTIGIDLAKKIFTVEGHRIQLEIWDTAGQEQYYSIVALHFREAKAFVVVYDVTDLKSFEQIRKYWLKSVDQYMDEPVPVFFAANKCDMSKLRQVSTEQGERLTSQQCAHGYFETSAKSGSNIENLFHRVAESMVSTWGAPKRWYEMDINGDLDGRWPNQVIPRETIRLTEPTSEPGKRNCCKTK